MKLGTIAQRVTKTLVEQVNEVVQLSCERSTKESRVMLEGMCKRISACSNTESAFEVLMFGNVDGIEFHPEHPDNKVLPKTKVHDSKAKVIAGADRRRASIKKIYEAAIHQVLAKAEVETLGNLNRLAVNESFANTEPVAGDFLFRLVNFSADFLLRMREAHRDAFAVSSKGVLGDVGIFGKTATPQGLVDDFINKRENKLKDVPQNIYDEIKHSLEQGAMEGESEAHLADRIRDSFDQVYEGRAETVARTETASVYGTANADAIEQAGFEAKKWLSAHDDRVREEHQDMDGEVVRTDEEFSNGLMYPGDPSGPPESVINCRCTVVSATIDELDE